MNRKILSLSTAVPLFADEDLFADDGESSFEKEIFDESVDDKIIGGDETTIDKHPHQVTVRHLGFHICGGSILTLTRALTAAGCLQQRNPPSSYGIYAGSTRRDTHGESNQQRRSISRFLRHPLYNPILNTNDIALLIWVQPLTLSPTVRPIRLPRQNAAVSYGRTAVVTGWGLTREGVSNSIADRLRAVSLPIVTMEVCNRNYGGRITPDMVCAGLPEGGRGTCVGDNGGPLVFNGVQVGVVSWGRGCGRPNFPTVFARVPSFITWIRQNL